MKIRKKAIPFILILYLLLCEFVIRIFFSTIANPSILLYGTKYTKVGFVLNEIVEREKSVVFADNLAHGYFKYYPNQKLFTRGSDGKNYRISINRRGFRGKDFTDKKENGVLRILCLGGSSTFGFGNKDEETYPYYLNEVLNSRISELNDKKINRIEVINLGIPHLKSNQIHALFVNEGLPLSPDVVMFYEGTNDARVSPKLNLFTGALHSLSNYFLMAKIVENMFPEPKFTKEGFENKFIDRTNFFIKNLSKIKNECLLRKIKFYVITQQARAYTPGIDNPMLNDITYEVEAKILREKFYVGKTCNSWEMAFLIHTYIMEELRKWAKQNNVELIDGLQALNNHRNCLNTWVHLNKKGNYLLAEEIANAIIKTYTVNRAVY